MFSSELTSSKKVNVPAECNIELVEQGSLSSVPKTIETNIKLNRNQEFKSNRDVSNAAEKKDAFGVCMEVGEGNIPSTAQDVQNSQESPRDLDSESHTQILQSFPKKCMIEGEFLEHITDAYRLCQALYEDNFSTQFEALQPKLPQLKACKSVPNREFAFVEAHYNKTKVIYVIFRGSQDFQKDWVDCNFNLRPVLTKSGCFHKGFYERAKLVEKFNGTLRQWYEKWCEKWCRDSKLYFVFTGHSLGGAAAQIAAKNYVNSLEKTGTRFDLKGMEHVFCVTFGAPLVGDREWERFINSSYDSVLKHHYVHLVAEGDPVPLIFSLLLEILNYCFPNKLVTAEQLEVLHKELTSSQKSKKAVLNMIERRPAGTFFTCVSDCETNGSTKKELKEIEFQELPSFHADLLSLLELVQKARPRHALTNYFTDFVSLLLKQNNDVVESKINSGNPPALLVPPKIKRIMLCRADASKVAVHVYGENLSTVTTVSILDLCVADCCQKKIDPNICNDTVILFKLMCLQDKFPPQNKKLHLEVKTIFEEPYDFPDVPFTHHGVKPTNTLCQEHPSNLFSAAASLLVVGHLSSIKKRKLFLDITAALEEASRATPYEYSFFPLISGELPPSLHKLFECNSLKKEKVSSQRQLLSRFGYQVSHKASEEIAQKLRKSRDTVSKHMRRLRLAAAEYAERTQNLHAFNSRCLELKATSEDACITTQKIIQEVIKACKSMRTAVGQIEAVDKFNIEHSKKPFSRPQPDFDLAIEATQNLTDGWNKLHDLLIVPMEHDVNAGTSFGIRDKKWELGYPKFAELFSSLEEVAQKMDTWLQSKRHTNEEKNDDNTAAIESSLFGQLAQVDQRICERVTNYHEAIFKRPVCLKKFCGETIGSVFDDAEANPFSIKKKLQDAKERICTQRKTLQNLSKLCRNKEDEKQLLAQIAKGQEIFYQEIINIRTKVILMQNFYNSSSNIMNSSFDLRTGKKNFVGRSKDYGSHCYKVVKHTATFLFKDTHKRCTSALDLEDSWDSIGSISETITCYEDAVDWFYKGLVKAEFVLCDGNTKTSQKERAICKHCKSLNINFKVGTPYLVSFWKEKFQCWSLIDEDVFEWACRLKFIMVIDSLRSALSSINIIGLFGTSRAGKSKLLSHLLQKKIQYGDGNCSRTQYPTLYNFPGSDCVFYLDTVGLSGRMNVDAMTKELLSICKVVVAIIEYGRQDEVSKVLIEMNKDSTDSQENLSKRGSSFLLCFNQIDSLLQKESSEYMYGFSENKTSFENKTDDSDDSENERDDCDDTIESSDFDKKASIVDKIPEKLQKEIDTRNEGEYAFELEDNDKSNYPRWLTCFDTSTLFPEMQEKMKESRIKFCEEVKEWIEWQASV